MIANVRPECLQPAEMWTQATGDEVREMLRITGLTGKAAANYLGLRKEGGRTIRRWVSEENPIPYAAWAMLCDRAGLGIIWREE